KKLPQGDSLLQKNNIRNSNALAMYSYAHPDKLYYNIQMNRPATNFSSKKYQTGCSKVVSVNGAPY
ncbi:TPA: hypothetical protein ACHJ99_005384, partial [Escherichia coli]